MAIAFANAFSVVEEASVGVLAAGGNASLVTLQHIYQLVFYKLVSIFKDLLLLLVVLLMSFLDLVDAIVDLCFNFLTFLIELLKEVFNRGFKLGESTRASILDTCPVEGH